MTHQDAVRDDLGVVEPWRIPRFVRRIGARLAPVGWVFIGLAILDAAIRLARLAASGPLEVPPVDAIAYVLLDGPIVVLLPVGVLMRRHDAARSTPLILRGTFAIAAAELITTIGVGLAPVLSLDQFPNSGSLPPLPFPLLPAAHLISVTAAAGGWVAIGLGLARMRDGQPTSIIRAIAWLVPLGVAVMTAAQVANSVDILAGLPRDVVGYVPTGIVNLVAAVLGGVWAYTGWVLVRGIGDPARPRRATRAGAFAAAATVLAGLATIMIWPFTPQAGNPPETLSVDAYQSLYAVITWLTRAAVVLLVAAFAMGLADSRTNVEEGRPG